MFARFTARILGLRLTLGSALEAPFFLDPMVWHMIQRRPVRRFLMITPGLPPLQTKMCLKCRNPKPLDDFWKHPKRLFGRQSWCKQCFRIYLSAWNHGYRHLKNQQSRETYARLRLEVLAYYSPRGVPECTCCGEQTIQFLAIDHVNGGGRQHRKAIHNTT